MIMSSFLLLIKLVTLECSVQLNQTEPAAHVCIRSSQEYQPSGAGGTRSPPAMPHRLQNPKWPLGALVIGHSEQLSQNRIFDPSTPMEKGCDRENGGEGGTWKRNGEEKKRKKHWK